MPKLLDEISKALLVDIVFYLIYAFNLAFMVLFNFFYLTYFNFWLLAFSFPN